ncbi:MAG: pentapeptide repeat-containing protein [Hyphomonadaceae bacterium]
MDVDPQFLTMSAVAAAVLLIVVVAAIRWRQSLGYKARSSGIAVWIGSFVSLWAVLALATHFWLVSGQFQWWRIDTWLSSEAELILQAATAGRALSELRIEEVRNLIGAVALFAGSLVGAIQIGNSLHRTRLQERERDADDTRLLSDRERLEGERHARNADVFSRAVQQLAEPDDARMASRIGAIYSLEALIRSEVGPDTDAPVGGELPPGEQRRDRPLVIQIVDTLAAFVRQRSRSASDPTTTVAPDVSVAVRVLVSVPAIWRPTFLSHMGVDLRGAHLVDLELPKFSDLRRFNLERVVLTKARLNDANIAGVNLAGSVLSDVKFGESDLTGADLSSATLDRAQLTFVKGLTKEQVEATKSASAAQLPTSWDTPANLDSEDHKPRSRGAYDTISSAFSRLTSGMSKEEAMLTILLAAAYSDRSERVTEHELAEVYGIAERSKTLRFLTRSRLQEIIDRIQPRLRDTKHFYDTLALACSALPNEMAEAVFAQACDIIFADRMIVESEKAFLRTLAERLKIPMDRAALIVNAASVKNEY